MNIEKDGQKAAMALAAAATVPAGVTVYSMMTGQGIDTQAAVAKAAAKDSWNAEDTALLASNAVSSSTLDESAEEFLYTWTTGLGQAAASQSSTIRDQAQAAAQAKARSQALAAAQAQADQAAREQAAADEQAAAQIAQEQQKREEQEALAMAQAQQAADEQAVQEQAPVAAEQTAQPEAQPAPAETIAAAETVTPAQPEQTVVTDTIVSQAPDPAMQAGTLDLNGQDNAAAAGADESAMTDNTAQSVTVPDSNLQPENPQWEDQAAAEVNNYMTDEAAENSGYDNRDSLPSGADYTQIAQPEAAPEAQPEQESDDWNDYMQDVSQDVAVPEQPAPDPVYEAAPAPEPVPEPVEEVSPEQQYADLNARISNAALGLVGVTNGMQCTEVVQLALANAGVSDAMNLWPNQYAAQYGYYTDNPQAGNLIYYNQGGNGLDHIAVYIGNGQAVHGNYSIDGVSYTVVASVDIAGTGDYSFIQVCR